MWEICFYVCDSVFRAIYAGTGEPPQWNIDKLSLISLDESYYVILIAGRNFDIDTGSNNM
jgi:hypothetical protein